MDASLFRLLRPRPVWAALLLASCYPPLRLQPSDAATVLAQQTLMAPDPAQRGPHQVLTLYYGSGTDKNRPEYRDSVTIRTEPVDGSKLVDLGESAKERNGYWGFTPAEMPINGRVWYPDGEGPFPLVLIVHGNHNMKDFSDPGYEYLGRLLASRGFILASVDMNFINGSIRGENDARGWLLLKHLQVWRRFNREEGPFHGKVDMEDIALMGHSRGGEAVGHAAAFNRLTHYPDDASLTFDFGFDIKGVVAIAPVDGQYRPTGRGAPVRDVSYLVFHGSHDGDVTSFHGLRQYERVSFTPGSGNFKAAVYVYRANHGQWNTVWGNHDSGGDRAGRILDLRGLLDPQDQRRIAELYVTAFLEATLHHDERWLPIFRDNRVMGDWLPHTMYVTRFQDATFRPLLTSEEDIDVTTGTEPGVRLRGDSLETWKEETLTLRSRNRDDDVASQENQAVWLGWNNRIAGADTTRVGPPARFVITLPRGLASRWRLGERSSLELALAATDRLPPPRKAPEEVDRSQAGEDERSSGAPDRLDDEGPMAPVDLTLEVEDGAGAVSRVALSRYGPVRRPLETHILRRSDQERERFPEDFELILQSYSVPLSDFTAQTPALDLRNLREVRVVFDRATAGEVVLDEVGFARMDPAFWAARVQGPQTGGSVPPSER